MNHPDHEKNLKFTTRARLDKTINTLLGIVEGIAIDGKLNVDEIIFFKHWLDEHAALSNTHPYNEFFPIIHASLANGGLSEEPRQDIHWICERLISTEYYDKTTADMQRLHGIIGGIIADGVITKEELDGLSTWMEEHTELKTCWPYDEIDSLITAVLQDGQIDVLEHAMLLRYFSEFAIVDDDRTITNPPLLDGTTIVGLCAVCPEVEFIGSKFCFTGASTRYTRKTLSGVVVEMGGEFTDTMSSTVQYLVIGADGNPCWKYACYGRKVEHAVKLRKAGSRLQIIHEHDFHDAVADNGR